MARQLDVYDSPTRDELLVLLFKFNQTHSSNEQIKLRHDKETLLRVQHLFANEKEQKENRGPFQFQDRYLRDIAKIPKLTLAEGEIFDWDGIVAGSRDMTRRLEDLRDKYSAKKPSVSGAKGASSIHPQTPLIENTSSAMRKRFTSIQKHQSLDEAQKKALRVASDIRKM